eukprot:1177113-Prorocentrum_minimum.AAC.1
MLSRRCPDVVQMLSSCCPAVVAASRCCLPRLPAGAAPRPRSSVTREEESSGGGGPLDPCRCNDRTAGSGPQRRRRRQARARAYVPASVPAPPKKCEGEFTPCGGGFTRSSCEFACSSVHAKVASGRSSRRVRT